MSKERLEAFSDGVIAILITIMALGLRTPHGSSHTSQHWRSASAQRGALSVSRGLAGYASRTAIRTCPIQRTRGPSRGLRMPRYLGRSRILRRRVFAYRRARMADAAATRRAYATGAA